MLEKRKVFTAGATVLLVAVSFTIGQLTSAHHARGEESGKIELAEFEGPPESSASGHGRLLAQKDEPT
ncbi:MAG: hypothetical protein K2Z81_04770, partial [Cyanobacteria bacterium]|nr:hypothetical protein [Cyanobacteriota bacterium]